MSISIGKLKQYLQSALDDCEQYEDAEEVKCVSNTYFIKDKIFMGITGVGYINLNNIETIDTDDEDEQMESEMKYYVVGKNIKQENMYVEMKKARLNLIIPEPLFDMMRNVDVFVNEEGGIIPIEWVGKNEVSPTAFYTIINRLSHLSPELAESRVFVVPFMMMNILAQ